MVVLSHLVGLQIFFRFDVIINELIFFISFLNCSLLIYENKTDFLYVNLIFHNLVELVSSSNSE